MSQIKKLLASGLFLLMGLFVLNSCGSTSNSPSAIDPAKEGHAAGWLLSGHAAAANADPVSCTQCHGSDLAGGISAVACTDCHLGAAQSLHPSDWDNLVAIRHAAYVRSNGNSACSNINCHGPFLTGVAGSGPSCTSCHIGGSGSVHPLDWGASAYVKHPLYVSSNGTDACSNINCHGADLNGVADSGPSCTSCHLGGLNSVHPLNWANNFLQHALYVGSSGTASCRNAVCHGENLQGVVLSGPSCFTCHQFPL